MAVLFGIQEKTARMLMQKIREAIKFSEDFSMKGIANIHKHIVACYKQDKPVRNYDCLKKKSCPIIDLTDDGKVKCFLYFSNSRLFC